MSTLLIESSIARISASISSDSFVDVVAFVSFSDEDPEVSSVVWVVGSVVAGCLDAC